MLPLDDPRWKTFKGGYHVPYDVSGPLKRLYRDGPSQALWEELWQELHHQSDVDTASYAAVPHLLEYARLSPRLDWNLFGLISTIELARPSNQPPPAEIAEGYFDSIQRIPEVVGTHPDHNWDELLTMCVVGCIALARGQRLLAKVYLQMTIDDAKQWYKHEFGYEPDES